MKKYLLIALVLVLRIDGLAQTCDPTTALWNTNFKDLVIKMSEVRLELGGNAAQNPGCPFYVDFNDLIGLANKVSENVGMMRGDKCIQDNPRFFYLAGLLESFHNNLTLWPLKNSTMTQEDFRWLQAQMNDILKAYGDAFNSLPIDFIQTINPYQGRCQCEVNVKVEKEGPVINDKKLNPSSELFHAILAICHLENGTYSVHGIHNNTTLTKPYQRRHTIRHLPNGDIVDVVGQRNPDPAYFAKGMTMEKDTVYLVGYDAFNHAPLVKKLVNGIEEEIIDDNYAVRRVISGLKKYPWWLRRKKMGIHFVRYTSP